MYEKRQRFSETPDVECPVCGEPAVRRVIRQVGVVFKGSGFYVTDSRGKSSAVSPAAASNGASGNGTAGGEGEKASESTPATSDSSKEAAPAASKETTAASAA